MVDQTQLDLADELDRLADEITVNNLAEKAIESAQIARRLDTAAAESLERISNVPRSGWGALVPRAKGVVRGVAKATRIDGAAMSGMSPTNVVNVQANSTATATSNGQVQVQIDALLADHDLPPEAKSALEDASAALARNDRPSAMERLASAASMLAAFPRFIAAIGGMISSVDGMTN